ncbi:unnamed protein product, partial [Mesorhabditis spiculigera]
MAKKSKSKSIVKSTKSQVKSSLSSRAKPSDASARPTTSTRDGIKSVMQSRASRSTRETLRETVNVARKAPSDDLIIAAVLVAAQTLLACVAIYLGIAEWNDCPVQRHLPRILLVTALFVLAKQGVDLVTMLMYTRAQKKPPLVVLIVQIVLRTVILGMLILMLVFYLIARADRDPDWSPSASAPSTTNPPYQSAKQQMDLLNQQPAEIKQEPAVSEDKRCGPTIYYAT